MKFIVDAQLPFLIVKFIRKNGYDVIHTDHLPNKERTKDSEIRSISLKENRIVITKDSDFFDSYILKGIPKKLLWVTTGNIKNDLLYKLFEKNFADITKLFENHNLIELDNYKIIVHE
jgi:predicted nuclease of predicted toxin-antitoxin system